MTYSVKATYLQHDGGTKFYETVLIHHKDGPTMLIKRWGKTNDFHTGGGQTKVERGNLSAMTAEEQKILAEKRKLRNGGKYLDSSSVYGLHGIKGSIDNATLKARLTHYQDRQVRDAVEVHFGLGDVDDIVAATGEDFVVEEPAIDRGSNWGSW